MSGWLYKIFGFKSKKVPSIKVESKAAEAVIPAAANTTVAPAAAVKPYTYTPSLGSQLSYGKWYYGVVPKAEPKVSRTPYGIEKRYPCKDGGEVVVRYTTRADKSSSLDVTKIGNQNDDNVGNWYRGFYSDTVVKQNETPYGDKVTKTIKKKGGRKQVLSTQNGRATEEVHVPLKRWQRTTGGLQNGKKENSYINPYNPRDFDRFCD